MPYEFPLLASYDILRIREKPELVPYGTVESTVAKKKCRCRACGHVIPKGAPRITFQWDYRGSGSWTAVESHIHAHDCTKGDEHGLLQSPLSEHDRTL